MWPFLGDMILVAAVCAEKQLSAHFKVKDLEFKTRLQSAVERRGVYLAWSFKDVTRQSDFH